MIKATKKAISLVLNTTYINHFPLSRNPTYLNRFISKKEFTVTNPTKKEIVSQDNTIQIKEKVALQREKIKIQFPSQLKNVK